MRLAFDGIVDFSHFDIRSPAWYTTLGWFVREMQRRDMLRFIEYSERRHIGYLAANLTPESWKGQQEKENKYHGDVVRLMLDLGSEEEQQTSMNDALRRAWAREFGDLDSPETKARIEATAAALRNQRGTGDK